MRRITKLLVCVLAALQLIFCFVGCNNTAQTPDTNVTETDAQNGELTLTLNSLSGFTVIYPKDSEIKRAAMSLASLIQDYTGTKPTVMDDSTPETECEILVGLTNREASVDFYKDMDVYDTGYALVGTKLLIIGSNKDTATDSVSLFKTEVLRKSDENSILLADGDSNIVKDVLRNGLYNWSDEDLSVLSGLTVNALGDSYFDGYKIDKADNWVSLFGKKHGINMNNYGISGSTVSNLLNKDPMCERYASMANNNADIILLEGGRNDFNKEVPIGSVNSYDTKTFSGALNTIIAGLKKKYPNAMIVCISNWNFPGSKSGNTYLTYANAMAEVAKKQGVYFIPAYDPEISGIDMTNESFREQYCIAKDDISHLNPEGMKIALAHFEKVIAIYYKDFLSKKQGA